ncbi:tumor necrosis factor alpha-induced protein 3 [Spea bombifrons]|uniref:tumor necrosis factor alpha-induced protein 3 n=1 Tax=Spea bombifrons TaxID=233779 RepID=UPI00234B4414|nr:tumor necrosis factor alpha-induced protein 3 [Spea bombifrons]XP_053316796.1 tumor necrosis factor alpha-induced protein 3 [Spea bombifrons]
MANQQVLPQDLYMSNMLKAVKIRDKTPQDIIRPSNGIIHHFKTMHRHTIEMFMVCQFCSQFRELLQNCLIDRAMQLALESQKQLNACREVKRLVPLKTNGDGNCLMHATSLYMWGVQDTDLVLRKTVYNVLRTTDTRNFKFRWQLECVKSIEFVQTGLRYDTRNWDEEWEHIVRMASAETLEGQNGLQYNCLEEIHIFVLVNILRRPIVVLADTVVRSLESGSSFSPLSVSGIYLPLHWPAQECYKYPIVLGYDCQHFAPLVTMKDSGPEIRAVPLVVGERGTFEDMKIHFLTEHEEKTKEKLLKEYLFVLEIPVLCWELGTTHIINSARLDEGNLPNEINLVEDYLQLVQHEYRRWQEATEQSGKGNCVRSKFEISLNHLSLVEVKCETPHCPFYMSVSTKPFCHECFEKNKQKDKQKIESVARRTEYLNSSGHKSRDLEPISALATAPSLFLFSDTNAMKCKTRDCPFTLNVEFSGLCERCHNAKQNASAKKMDRTKNIDIIQCNVCLQDTTRTFNGMCSFCFKRTTEHLTSSSFPSMVHQRDISEPPSLSRRLVRLTGHEAASSESRGSLVILQSSEPYNTEDRTVCQKCRKSGCPFFGTQQNEGFCTLCYLEFQENSGLPAVRSQKLPGVLGQTNIGASTFKNMSRCLGRECSTLGSTLLEGYCQKCFIEAQNQCYTEARNSDEQLQTQRTAQNRASKHSNFQLKICARSLCNNTVVCKNEDLCEQCRNRAAHHKPTGDDLPKQRCRATGCDHYGNNKCSGFCNECYRFKQLYG